MPAETDTPAVAILGADATDADPLLGQTINDTYRVNRLLGQGGMGNVYEAADLRFNKRVALKAMHRELVRDKRAVALFRREAEVTSRLAHPHIVQAFDFGVMHTGQLYLVMEFLQGEDLDKRLRRAGRLSSTIALRVIKQTAAALAATHAKGIIHRDIKPANIFLCDAPGEADYVKVIDFGVNKACRASELQTQPDPVLGTPHYMSPEQALGQVDTIDERTDQWALACIAWEALSGRTPFVAKTIQSLLLQVVYEAPPALRLACGLAPRLERVLLRALCKRKEERFESVLAFAEALEDAVNTREHPWTLAAEETVTPCPMPLVRTAPTVGDWPLVRTN